MPEAEAVKDKDQGKGQDKAQVVQEEEQQAPVAQGGLVHIHQSRQVDLAGTGQLNNGNEKTRKGRSQHKEGQHRKGADNTMGQPF